jgi:SAM-dependent methyltransferase
VLERQETRNYIEHVDALLAEHPLDEAMALAVGGDYSTVGRLERALVLYCGLPPNGTLVDVGCGSGRAGFALRDLPIRYVGTDVVPKLTEYAAAKCARDDWRFVVTDGISIPEPAASVDMVSFFSVFTHLRHEECWLYLCEAKRVLKEGGRILFSFLDFGVPFHWQFFEHAVGQLGSTHPATIFIDHGAVRAWAAHLDLSVVRIYDATEPFINDEFPFFGHSFAVLEKAMPA